MTRIKKNNIKQSVHIESSKPLFIPFSLYGRLIKSKQTFLLLYTGAFTYLISAWGRNFDLIDLFWLIVGQFLAISGSTLLNMYFDRDIDSLMKRTKERPLPKGQVRPSSVFVQGIIFSGAGILITGYFLNFITMIIGLLGVFFDVIIYTLWLKRRSRFSIILGGVAGGLPAVGGRTAALGIIDPVAGFLLIFVLCWIPVHNLSLALISDNLEDYKDAQIPLPSINRDMSPTMRIITVSACLSAIIIIITGLLLEIHSIALIILIGFSLYLIYLSFGNFNAPSNTKIYKIFKFASMYMLLAFLILFGGILLIYI